MRSSMLWLLSVSFGVVMTAGSAANATVITFEGHADDFDAVQFDSGYMFTTLAAGWGILSDGFPFSPPMVQNGTTRYIADGDRNGGAALVQIKDVGGTPFTLNGFDASTAFTTFPTGRIEVTGFLNGGGTVSTFFDVTNSFSTFVLPATFTNLLSVQVADTFSGSFTSVPGFGLDNIVINGATAVPEPGTVLSALVGVGIAGLGLRRRRAA